MTIEKPHEGLDLDVPDLTGWSAESLLQYADNCAGAALACEQSAARLHAEALRWQLEGRRARNLWEQRYA